MRRLGRLLFKFLMVAVLLPVLVGAFQAYAHGWPSSWRTANWASSGLLPDAAAIPGPRVIILAARTGNWKSIFAEHMAIVLKPEGAVEWTRYDVVGWGKPVRRNAYVADAMWFGNRPYVVKDISGEAAGSLISRIEASIAAYPYSGRGTYAVWPGPNSNSFVAWVVRNTEGFEAELPPTAVGKDFLGPGFGLASAASRTGYVVSLYGTLGITLALREGFEINFFGSSVGIDPEELAIKLPSLGKLSLLDLFG